MMKRNQWQKCEYDQCKHAMPSINDTISVESLVDIQQIVVAQREKHRQLLQYAIHCSHGISKTSQRERQYAPKRAQAHGEAHLPTYSEKENGKPLRTQYSKHAYEYHWEYATIARELQIAIEANCIEYGNKPEHQSLWQQLSHDSCERRIARHSIEHKLCISLPLQPDSVSRRQHHQ